MIALLSVAFAAESDRIPAPEAPPRPLVDTATPRASDTSWTDYVRGPGRREVGDYLATRPGVVTIDGRLLAVGGVPASQVAWYVDGVRVR
ncbi:MAG: hypothetical protein ACOZNI_36090 [Myxococcota bacterium]